MKKITKNLKFNASTFRLVIRNIDGYGTFPIPTSSRPRQPNLCPALDALKQQVLQYLLQQQSKRKTRLLNWSIAWQTHAASGLPHLDILIVFQKNLQVYLTSFDYLIKDLKIQQRDVGDQVGVGHVWITPYSSKRLNKAILDYGLKEDPNTLTNISEETKNDLIRLHKLKADPYLYLYDQMCKDPLHFNLQQYVKQHQLSMHISSWSSLKTKLKDMQVAAANLALKNKPGFRFIDRHLIQSTLSPQQLLTFDSWSGYQLIVDKLNQIVSHGYNRPFKTKQLLLIGKPDIGKTALIRQVQKYCSTYHMDTSNWFPKYRDGVYRLFAWNQFKLKGGMSHTDLLKFLQGYPMDLEYKGGSALKNTNPLVIMTSNMTLGQHIYLKFKDRVHRDLARDNLKSRILEIVIPSTNTLFILLKLIKSKI